MIAFNQAHKVLVTKGGLGMFAKNQAVFTITNGKYKLEVPEGQFFAMDAKTLLSVDATSTSFPNPIKIGVAQANGQPRWLTGEELFPKNIEAITAKTPVCGSPDVWDITWSCTQCFNYYGLLLRVRDNDTMSWSGYKLGDETFFADARADCSSTCGECSPTATCEGVQEDLVDALNEQLQAVDLKAFATKLYANSQVFCFKPTNDLVCNASCAEYAGVSEVAWGEGENEQTIAFDLDAVTSMDALVASLQEVVDALHADEDFEGSAFVTGGYLGSNCCVQLHINSADEVTITDNADQPAEYTACSEPINTDLTDKCGIRVIGTPIANMTACTMVKELGYYARNLELFATTPSFEDATITHVSSTHLPQLFGLFVQHEEYEQVIGGQNRNYNGTNTLLMDGLGVNLDSKSRLMNALTFAEAGTSYVGFSIEGSHPHASVPGHALNPYPWNGEIYVPECDSTTVTAVQAFLNKLGDVNGLTDLNIGGSVFKAGDNII